MNFIPMLPTILQTMCLSFSHISDRFAYGRTHKGAENFLFTPLRYCRKWSLLLRHLPQSDMVMYREDSLRKNGYRYMFELLSEAGKVSGTYPSNFSEIMETAENTYFR